MLKEKSVRIVVLMSWKVVVVNIINLFYQILEGDEKGDHDLANGKEDGLVVHSVQEGDEKEEKVGREKGKEDHKVEVCYLKHKRISILGS